MKNLFTKIKWRELNIPLLLFLILFLNVKFIIKLAAIVLIMVYTRKFKPMDLITTKQFPIFYSLIILIEPIKYFLVNPNFSLNYTLAFGFGILQWALSLLALYNIKLIIEKENTQKIHHTIKAFFLINFIVSAFFLALLIFHPSWLTFWNHGSDISFSHPSAGDVILGISFDASTVNAAINCLGLIYFIYKSDYKFSFICLITIILCTSNVSFLFIAATLALMVITLRSGKRRISAMLAGILLLSFYFILSPQNRQYIRNYFVQLYIVNKNPELLSPSEGKTVGIAAEDSLYSNRGTPEGGHGSLVLNNTGENQEKRMDSIYSFNEEKLEKAASNLFSIERKITDDGIPQLALTDADFLSKPGKLISYFQTCNYLTSDARHFIFGSGMGNFSSKLAFRTSGVNILGSYPKKYEYLSPEFKENHFRTFSFYYNGPAALHSVINYPFSVYNQLAGEYGLLGILLFVIFYLGFFLKRFKSLSYGKYILFIMLAFFTTEYWFEFYSLVVFFELFMLLNLKESREQIAEST